MPYTPNLSDHPDSNSRRQFLKQSLGWGVAASLTPGLFNACDSLFAANLNGKARTVLGDVPVSQLGMTLMHEHAPTVDWSELYENKAGDIAPIRDEMIKNTAGLLQRFHESLPANMGPGAIVECTPIRVGRYPQLMKDLAEQTDVHIIASTGFWCEAAAPQHEWAIQLGYASNGVRNLAELFIREIEEGMEDPYGNYGERFTDIKAGMIKIATSEYLRPSERRVHEAAVIAHRETGCPITTHTSRGGGLEEAMLFQKHKAEPSKICIGHQGYKDDRKNEYAYEYHRQIAELGFNVQFDRVGLSKYKPGVTAEMIKRLVETGHTERILVSHDAVPYVYTKYAEQNHEAEGWEFDEVDFTQCSTSLIEEMKKLDIDEKTIHTILVVNPQRVLALN